MTVTVDALFQAKYFSDLDVHFAKTIASLAGETDPLVQLGAALASRCTRVGHVCAPLFSLFGTPVPSAEGVTIPDAPNWPTQDQWIPSLEQSPLIGRGDPPTPLVLEWDRLYLFRYWSYEQRLAAELLERAVGSVDPPDGPALQAVFDAHFKGDSAGRADQRRAAQVALTKRLCIISGGPGTGKTTTVVKILAFLVDRARLLGHPIPRMVLLAPTGKAATRLTQAIQSAKAGNGDADVPESALTIHRALGVRPHRPTHCQYSAENRLLADVVVVDEASMVDIALMTKLAEAIPQESRLILVGDKDQLASVEAGAVLADMDLPDSVVSLSFSHRFDSSSGIGRFAKAINDGQSERATRDVAAGQLPNVTLVETSDAHAMRTHLTPFVLKHYKAYATETDPQKKLDLFNKFRILCAYRAGPWGLAEINRLTADILRQAGTLQPHGEWYDGRPILIAQNDYHLDLYNGDVGIVHHSPKDAPAPRVIFDAGSDGVRSLSCHRLPPCETVFAMTVHKAQGSEFDHILIVLPDAPSPIITRELLYTAVTRARKEVVLIGPGEIIAHAIATPTERASGLGDRLRGRATSPSIP
ncbi:MAG: AAA family ATPase [Myxococcota bacterium]|nr:AAA family ATPase [Myxococcota bacterium]